MSYPKVITVRQNLLGEAVADPKKAAIKATESLGLQKRIKSGHSVAIPVGSRGIANLAEIVKGVITALQELGAKPFIIPAMGSHGGGTAEGQTELLASYGVTESEMGVPVLASMDVVEIGTTKDGFDVLLDRHASEADHILILNRIKPHTGFDGPFQSGLMKMLLIGLGKHKGAINYHRAAVHMPFEQLIRSAGAVVLANCAVAGGLAILENGYDETADIVGVQPHQFLTDEPKLLERAASMMPGVPFDGLDLLIIDRMGKDISGAGMDSIVLRRKPWAGQGAADESPDRSGPMRVYVRDLTDASHGNAAGIGLADYAAKRLVDKIDRDKTYINCITSAHPRGAMIPVVCPDDRQALEWALMSAGVGDPAEVKLVRITDTLHLATMEVSEAAMECVQPGAEIFPEGVAKEMQFDDSGMFVPDVIPTG